MPVIFHIVPTLLIHQLTNVHPFSTFRSCATPFPNAFSHVSLRFFNYVHPHFCNFPQVFPTHVSHISRIFHGFFMISNHFYAIFGPVPSPSSPHLRNVPAAELMQFDWDDWGIGNSPVPRVAWLGTGLFFGGKPLEATEKLGKFGMLMVINGD
jgi:hypothetical protein